MFSIALAGGGDDVGHRVADVDAGELQGRWLEPVVAGIDRRGGQGGGDAAPAGAPGCRRDADRRRGPACRAPRSWQFTLPRRPILTMSPSFTGQVGSPTRQKSGIWPLASIHSSTLTVPSTAGPSSSPVISRLIEPFGRTVGQVLRRGRDEGGDRALHVAGAAAVQHAVAHLAAERIGAASCAAPTGTTSVWPAKQTCGAPVPRRAKRLSISPKRSGGP